MIPSFDEWMAANCSPAGNYTFGQYGRYLEGWRNAMPWAYKGMSVAYDQWAESKWDEIQDRSVLQTAWKEGMALVANAVIRNAKVKKDDPDRWVAPIDTAWADKTVEEAADFALTIRDTIASLVCMGSAVFYEQPSEEVTK